MSACLFLFPLAIGIITSSIEGTAAIVNACQHSKRGRSEKIQTRFADNMILSGTLDEMGVSYTRKGDSIVADFGEGKIEYSRDSVNAPYSMEIYGVKDMNKVACNVEAVDKEYGSNVQQYTYNRVKNNLPDNMSMESEQILEDDSILLTINVD